MTALTKTLSHIAIICLATSVPTLVSCEKTSGADPCESCEEIAFRSSSQQTKGWVLDDMDDTPFSDLHSASPSTTPRDLRVSAYKNTVGASEGETYFRDEVFSKNGDGCWHHDPPILWPLQSTVDFLAISFGSTAPSVTWNRFNPTRKVEIQVTDAALRDDIAYAYRRGVHSSEGLTLEFKHTQAWISVAVKNTGDKAVVLNSVKLQKIFTDGLLTVTANDGKADFEWDFRASTGTDKLIPDGLDVYGKTLTDSYKYLDMLIPEQEKTALLVSYLSDGNPVTKTFSFAKSRWIAGCSYNYVLDFNEN